MKKIFFFKVEILLTITYTFLFIFIIHKSNFFEINGLSKKTISIIFILKILAGLAVWALYTFYYTDRTTADIYKYFDDSKIIFDAIKTSRSQYLSMLTGIGNNSAEYNYYYSQMHYWAKPIDSNMYNDSHTIIRFNALVRLFSFGYYNVHTVFLCFLSLTGLTAIYKTFVPFLADKKNELLFAVFLLPSVLFWGSGVLKEGIIFFALGILIYYSNKLFSIKSILICLAIGFLLAFSKFYVWLSILPAIVFLILMNKTNNQKAFIKFFAVILSFSLVGLNIDKFTTVQNPLVTLSQKQIEFNKLASGKLTDSNNKSIAVAGSKIELKKLEPTFVSFLQNSPEALLNVMFRPYLSEIKSPIMLLAAAENLLIVCFCILCLLFIQPIKNIEWTFVLFCFSFVVFQFLIIGETTSVTGAIVRYKVSALPFLLTGFLFLLDKNKLTKKFNLKF